MREKKLKLRKKDVFFHVIMGAIIAVFIVFIINSYASRLVGIQTSRNQLLQNEITVLDAKIKKMKFLKQTRMALISRRIQ